MLDRHLHPRLKPALNQLAALLDRPFISPDRLTLAGFAIGVLALPFLALNSYLAALIAIALNRLLDGLDGALARRRGLSDAGGFLDIALDFLFYALVPFGFALAAPAENALAAAWLLFAFMGTGSSFLAFAALAAKHNIDNPGYAHKSFYYIGGLTEGTETMPCSAGYSTFSTSRQYRRHCAWCRPGYGSLPCVWHRCQHGPSAPRRFHLLA
jgi:phosphatidylglycerophosphate synthase